MPYTSGENRKCPCPVFKITVYQGIFLSNISRAQANLQHVYAGPILLHNTHDAPPIWENGDSWGKWGQATLFEARTRIRFQETILGAGIIDRLQSSLAGE